MMTWYWLSAVYMTETGPLPEGVVERIVEQLRRDAEARGRVAVVRQLGLQALILLVAVDVGEDRDFLQRQ